MWLKSQKKVNQLLKNWLFNNPFLYTQKALTKVRAFFIFTTFAWFPYRLNSHTFDFNTRHIHDFIPKAI